MRTRKDDTQLARTMRTSIIEGVFAQAYSSLVTPGCVFITKFAYLLKAQPIHFSLISSIGQFAQVFQLIGVLLSRQFTTRKRITVFTAGIGRFLTFFLGLALVIASPTLSIWFFLALLLLSSAILSMSGNIWIAWIADSIPLSVRGRFFSVRSQILMFFGMVVGYVFSFFIDCFSASSGSVHEQFINTLHLSRWFVPENEGIGLSVVFILGTLLGMVGLIYLNRQPERPPQPSAKANTDDLWEPLRDKNFRRLLLFGVWWMLAIGIGSPFWQPFMIGVLGMNTLEVVLYGTIQTISMLFWYRVWGKFIDRFGNKTLMKILIVLGGINPLFWLFIGPDGYGIVWLEALLSGAMWSGAGLVSTNFVLAVAPRGKEQSYSGLYAAITGLAMMATMMLSGGLYPKPMTIMGLDLTSEQVLFGLTGVCRWTAEIPLQFVHEPRGTSFRKSFYLINQELISRFAYLRNWIVRQWED
jgi:MFS family permease